MTLPVIEGDIVRFKNSKALYKIRRDGSRLVLAHEGSGHERAMPCPSQLVLVERKPTRIQEKLIDSFDTSGFDALNSAGNDAMLYGTGGLRCGKTHKIALGTAMHEALLKDYNESDAKITEKMFRHGTHYSMGIDFGRMEGDSSIIARLGQGRGKTNKLKGQGQGGSKMSIQINSLVAKVTDNIKDAQLVTKYFGQELNEASIKDEFFVRDNYDKLLEVAQAREEKEIAAREKLSA